MLTIHFPFGGHPQMIHMALCGRTPDNWPYVVRFRSTLRQSRNNEH